MLRFELDFEPHHFEKDLVQQTKGDIRARLEGHDIQDLKIILKKKPGNHIRLHFMGDPETVEKAKGLLGIY